LYNGVRARHLDAALEAREGIYYSDTGELSFYGDAVFIDSLRQLNADTLIYYEKQRITIAKGNVKITQEDKTFWAEHVKYLKNMRVLEVSGGVTIKDDSLKSSISGMKAVYNDSTGYGIITGEPSLTKEDNLGKIITVTCKDTLEVLKEQKITRLWNSVVVTKDSMKAISDMAVYDHSAELITLSGYPEVHYVIHETRNDISSVLRTPSLVTGDTIKVQLRERRISGAEVIGPAVSRTTSTDSTGAVYDMTVIESANMHLQMEEDFVSLVSAEGTARCYYHKRSTDSNKMFVNVATGDTLNFYFNKGEIEQFEIFCYGGGLGKGKYYSYEPEKIPAEPDSIDFGESATINSVR